MRKSTFILTCLLLIISFSSVVLSGEKAQDNRVYTACEYLAKNQPAKAEKLLHNPQTAQEKGLYATLIGKDSIRARSLGLTVFDIDKANSLAKEALPHLQESAKKNALSARILGFLYYEGIGVDKDAKKAFQYSLQGAEKGHPMAMYNVGICYLNGIGVDENKEKAIKWLRRAAGRGNTLAMTSLASIYRRGDIVRENERIAISFCERAAKLGNSLAMYSQAADVVEDLASRYDKQGESEPTSPSAFPFFAPSPKLSRIRKNREKRHQDKLKRHQAGLRALEAKRQNLIEQAAKAGFVPAMMHVAYFYENGFGYEQSDKKAFEWYSRAAESSLAEPLFMLAQCYRNGFGTQKDTQQAKILFDKAAEATKKQKSKKVAEKLALLMFLQDAELVLLDWSWHNEYGFAIVNGQVKNTSERPMHNVEVVASFKTKAGKLVTSDSSLIELNPIMPGQVSPFKVMSTYNPLMETVNIAFHNLLGGPILWVVNPEPLDPLDCVTSIIERFK